MTHILDYKEMANVGSELPKETVDMYPFKRGLPGDYHTVLMCHKHRLKEDRTKIKKNIRYIKTRRKNK